MPTRPDAPGALRALAVALVALALAGCWPAPGQGPDRRSHNPFESAISPPTVGDLAELWRASTGGWVGVRPPVVSAGGVHVSDGFTLVTFDAGSGAERWRSPVTLPVEGMGDPFVADDRVLASYGVRVGFGGSWNSGSTWHDVRTGAPVEEQSGGPVSALRGDARVRFAAAGPPEITIASLEVAPDGEWGTGWRTIVGVGPTTPAGLATGSTVGEQAVYHAGSSLDSFEPQVTTTGVRAWSLEPPPVCATLPPYPDLTIACPTWSTPTEGTPVGAPVIGSGGDVLYVATDAGELLALDSTSGTVVWRADLGAPASASPAFDGTTLFVPLATGRLAAVPAGQCGAGRCPVAWTAPTHGAGLQPAVAGGVVVVATDSGAIRAFDTAGCGAARCRASWRDDAGIAFTGAPAISGGRIFVGAAEGTVIAYALPGP